ncbi:MAG: gamma-glutamyl-gamma-aminobutyrate hydrolase family protein [Thermoleophilaceae bacterium]
MTAHWEPVIGICSVHETARWSFWEQPAHLVADSYVSAVQRTGAIALILPIDARAPEALLDRIDGLMLIGGADIDPEAYDAERDPKTEATYPERDSFETTLLRGALERELPVFGICRGMQLMNVALGGTLLQDLTADDGTNPHRKALGSFEGTEHEVRLDPGSLVARASGEEVHVARCHHHQGIDRVGEGLSVSGRAVVDGLPEAVEASDGRWLLGVQWHPEADERSKLFTDFANAARSKTRSWTKGPHLTPRAEPAI